MSPSQDIVSNIPDFQDNVEIGDIKIVQFLPQAYTYSNDEISRKGQAESSGSDNPKFIYEISYFHLITLSTGAEADIPLELFSKNALEILAKKIEIAIEKEFRENDDPTDEIMFSTVKFTNLLFTWADFQEYQAGLMNYWDDLPDHMIYLQNCKSCSGKNSIR